MIPVALEIVPMRSSLACALLAALALSACGGGSSSSTIPSAASQGPAHPSGSSGSGNLHLFVSNHSEISVYDEATDALLATVYETTEATCGQTLFTSMVLSRDNSTLYISQVSAVPGLTGIAMFNTTTNTFEGVIPFPKGTTSLGSLILGADGTTLYGTANGGGTDGAVLPFSTSTQTFEAPIPVPYANGVAQDPTSGLLYVAAGAGGAPGGAGSNTYAVIQVVSPSSGSIVATDDFLAGTPSNDDEVALDPILGHIYTGDVTLGPTTTSTVADVSESAGTLDDQISPALPYRTALGLTNPTFIVDSAAAQLYLASSMNGSSPYVLVYNAGNDTQVTAIPLTAAGSPVGVLPDAMGLSQDQQRLYVEANSTINVISTATDAIATTFSASPPVAAFGDQLIAAE
jgi:hypothetical protein